MIFIQTSSMNTVSIKAVRNLLKSMITFFNCFYKRYSSLIGSDIPAYEIAKQVCKITYRISMINI